MRITFASALPATLWKPVCGRCGLNAAAAAGAAKAALCGQAGAIAEGFVETGAVARVALVGTAAGPMMPNAPPRWKRPAALAAKYRTRA
jgi:hypothetical protein